MINQVMQLQKKCLNGTYSNLDGEVPGRVALVLPWSPDCQGGVTSMVVSLANHLPLDTVIIINDWHARCARFERGLMRFRFNFLVLGSVLSVAKSLVTAPVRILQLYFLLRSNAVYAVNFHYSSSIPALGPAILRWIGVYRGALVLSYHGTDVRSNQVGAIGRWIDRFVFRQVSAFVACSKGLARRMSDELGLPLDDIVVIYNGVDGALFRPQGSATRKDDHRPYLMSVGAFIARKDHATLVKAFSIIADEIPTLDLVLCGADGPVRPSVTELVQQLGLTQRVRFEISIQPERVAALLAAAEICVQPALSEGFPLAALEAAAAGCPLLVSDIPGHDELIVSDQYGKRFPVQDAQACAVAIAELLHAPATRTQCASVLRARVLNEFTWETCANRYASLYRLADSRRGVAAQ